MKSVKKQRELQQNNAPACPADRRDGPACADKVHLTHREVDVLRSLASGLLVKEIAHQSGRTVSTIEKQMRSARRKLKAATTTQAVCIAMDAGAISATEK